MHGASCMDPANDLACVDLLGACMHSESVASLCPLTSHTLPAKLSSIAIKGPADGSGPKKVKLFTNQPSCGFSDAESLPAAQEFELTPEQLSGEPIT